MDGHTQHFGDIGDWLYNLTADITETNNLAGEPRYAATVARMKERLALAGRDGPPPAYAFLPGAAQDQAVGAVHAIAQQVGALEPSDYISVPPTPPPPGPNPDPDPDPEGAIIPPAQCDRAAGILDKKKVACCPKTCGTCGGHDCRDHPGGAANCCTKYVQAGKRVCATDPAPCHG